MRIEEVPSRAPGAFDVDTTPANIEASKCPWSLYDDLRSRGRVLEVAYPQGFPSYAVTHFEDVVAVLQDDRLSKVFPATDLTAQKLGWVFSQRASHLLNTDPPNHTRLRRLVSKAFTPRRIEALRPHIQEVVDDLLADMSRKEEADLIEDLALPLSLTVICELLGVPKEDRDDFRRWSVAATTPGSQATDSSEAGAQALFGYIAEHIAERRKTLEGLVDVESAPDVLSRMIVASESGDALSDEELMGTAFLLLIAGHETTVGLVGSIALGLWRRQDQRQLLIDEPDLIDSAVEEFLRYDGPVQRTTFRIATEDIVVGDSLIPKGSQVLAYLGAANHDPSQFEKPEEIDITRQIDRHMAFGQGVHFCLGAPLARMEAQIAISSLLREFPGYSLSVDEEDLVYLPTVVRALSALPVKLLRD